MTLAKFDECLRVSWRWLWVLAFGACSCAVAEPIDFNRDIRPIFAKCIKCHGPDSPEAELNLTDRESAVASEAIVTEDHVKIHQHPQAILEVQRVLLEHLSYIDGAPIANTERDVRR